MLYIGLPVAVWGLYQRLRGEGGWGFAALKMLRVARRIVREIIALNPQPPPEYYKNLGIICYRLRSSEPDAEAEMIRAWQTYLRLGPSDDPEMPAMRRVLKRALAKP